MLKSRCRVPPCRNMAVKTRHHSPACTSGGYWENRAGMSSAGKISWRANIATLMAISPQVTGVTRRSAWVMLRAGITRVRCSGVVHSGHFWPTTASREHSTQMGRPQLLQARRVGRSGWR